MEGKGKEIETPAELKQSPNRFLLSLSAATGSDFKFNFKLFIENDRKERRTERNRQTF